MNPKSQGYARLLRVGAKFLAAYALAFLIVALMMWIGLLLARHFQAWPFA